MFYRNYFIYFIFISVSTYKKYKCVEITECKFYMRVDDTNITGIRSSRPQDKSSTFRSTRPLFRSTRPLFDKSAIQCLWHEEYRIQNFMKVHTFLLKGWFSSLNPLCELVSNRKSSLTSSSAREYVTSTCYPRFKNIWNSNESDKTSMTGKFFFFLWQATLLEKPWLHLKSLHFSLTLIPLLISPKPLTI